jgi:hypothetical protein
MYVLRGPSCPQTSHASATAGLLVLLNFELRDLRPHVLCPMATLGPMPLSAGGLPHLLDHHAGRYD